MKLYCIIALSLLLRPETAAAQQEEFNDTEFATSY